MEKSERLILRHKKIGYYISYTPEDNRHTRNLRSARRFINQEQLDAWLLTSHYAPDKPDEYEPVEIEIEYRLKEGFSNEQSSIVSKN